MIRYDWTFFINHCSTKRSVIRVYFRKIVLGECGEEAKKGIWGAREKITMTEVGRL